MKKNNLMSGAFVLSVGAVLSKVFSAIYRIALTRILGGVGIGIYQLIFPFYSLCVVLATAGLPMAISKVISKHKGNEAGVIKKCFLFTSVVALTLSFILFISSKGLAKIQGQSEISLCYVILAPTIIIVSVMSVLRGYFQGKHNFVPSSISNIVEQFVKMCAGLILSLSLISISLFAAIVGAVVAIVISESLSFVILLLYIKKEKLKVDKKQNVTIKEIAKDVLPITLTNIVLPISSFVDSLIVVNLLSTNFSNKMSVFLYGLESGAVSSLVTIPTIFSFAIASVILPNLTSLKHSFSRNVKLSLAIKTVLIITIPCVVSFILVPNRLIEFLYGSKLNAYGIDGVKIASSVLSLSGFGIVFLSVNQIYSSCLQAVDERFVTIRNLTIAVVAKFVIELIFMPSKMLNIYALAIANSVCYVIVMVLNHLEIKQDFTLNIEYEFWAKLIFANCVMVLSLVAIMSIEKSVVNTLLAVLVSVVVYLLILIRTNILTKKDKAMFKYKV
ncbi:MAG: oligosaccharide flippase family protein [Clostridia bacterium]|nr:oligosaccharide flippase family protein [Clostridia bacterium]